MPPGSTQSPGKGSCLTQVLSPAGREMVVGGLTHPLVPNAQCRAMVGRSRKCSQGRWRQQYLCEQRRGAPQEAG